MPTLSPLISTLFNALWPYLQPVINHWLEQQGRDPITDADAAELKIMLLDRGDAARVAFFAEKGWPDLP